MLISWTVQCTSLLVFNHEHLTGCSPLEFSTRPELITADLELVPVSSVTLPLETVCGSVLAPPINYVSALAPGRVCWVSPRQQAGCEVDIAEKWQVWGAVVSIQLQRAIPWNVSRCSSCSLFLRVGTKIPPGKEQWAQAENKWRSAWGTEDLISGQFQEVQKYVTSSKPYFAGFLFSISGKYIYILYIYKYIYKYVYKSIYILISLLAISSDIKNISHWLSAR